MTDTKRYNIEALLNSGVQPLPDLPDEDLEQLSKSLGRGPLADPVSVSSDGILLDGHQRLKALAMRGTKTISEDSVRIVDKANRRNALEWAVKLNVQRRHLSTEDKAALARRLQHERHWSQRQIARAFGVSQPAVSKWLNKLDEPDDQALAEPPPFVRGEDGKTYSARAPRHPWRAGGRGYQAVTKARRELQQALLDDAEPLGDMSPVQLAALGQAVSDLLEAAQELSDRIEEAS